jgi:hypothetical protein
VAEVTSKMILARWREQHLPEWETQNVGQLAKAYARVVAEHRAGERNALHFGRGLIGGRSAHDANRAKIRHEIDDIVRDLGGNLSVADKAALRFLAEQTEPVEARAVTAHLASEGLTSEPRQVGAMLKRLRAEGFVDGTMVNRKQTAWTITEAGRQREEVHV